MIYEDEICFIKHHSSTIPWLEIHAKSEQKELSDDLATTEHIFHLALKIEKAMIDFYKPTKINHASFANYLPKAHWHIMARFADDSHYPESMWGVKQRDGKDYSNDFDKFCEYLLKILNK